MSPDEQVLRRHRALADPSRARILAELADAGPLDARELAELVDLHVNTVRVHVNALIEAGLVESETLPPQGRGRPRVAYRSTAAAGDEGGRRYRLLAEILTALVARFGAEASEQLEEIGEAWGHYLVDSPPPYAQLSDEQAVERLVALLGEIGFQPKLEQQARGRQIQMRPCPFLELARSHQDVICPIHLGLIRGALAELGAKTRATKLEPFVRPDLCVARLARR
ncbi:MAG TPA: helix-turn-helix domain-containing protein [Solirubrobacteraceae bacterium]|jgi:predicted ArsR family transcriptional regulator|nr:helix-turn-helix domain-containing protein [Solirubrobacteraceae bacterium]